MPEWFASEKQISFFQEVSWLNACMSHHITLLCPLNNLFCKNQVSLLIDFLCRVALCCVLPFFCFFSMLF